MSHLIGITGTIGSGKSTIGAILEKRGIPVIDTDKLVHKLFVDDKNVIAAIIHRFGKDVLHADGTVDRVKLGALVFSDAVARKSLETIVHPATIMACRKEVERLKDNALVAILVPLLFEAGLQDEYNEIWTSYTDEKVLKERLKNRDKFDEAEIERRLAAQLSQKEKCARATHVIDNSGTLTETERQVNELLAHLNQPKL